MFLESVTQTFSRLWSLDILPLCGYDLEPWPAIEAWPGECKTGVDDATLSVSGVMNDEFGWTQSQGSAVRATLIHRDIQTGGTPVLRHLRRY